MNNNPFRHLGWLVLGMTPPIEKELEEAIEISPPRLRAQLKELYRRYKQEKSYLTGRAKTFAAVTGAAPSIAASIIGGQVGAYLAQSLAGAVKHKRTFPLLKKRTVVDLSRFGKIRRTIFKPLVPMVERGKLAEAQLILKTTGPLAFAFGAIPAVLWLRNFVERAMTLREMRKLQQRYSRAYREILYQ